MPYKLMAKRLGQKKRLLTTQGKPEIYVDVYAAEGRAEQLRPMQPSLLAIGLESISQEEADEIWMYHGYDPSGRKLSLTEQNSRIAKFIEDNGREPSKGF